MQSQFPKSAEFVKEHLEELQDEVIAQRGVSDDPTEGRIFDVMQLLKSEGCNGALKWEAHNLITHITINTPDD